MIDYVGIILAGGKGTRLGALTHDLPKPMIQIQGMPLIEHHIHLLKSYGINHIMITVNHQASIIEDYFKSGASWDVTINYIHEPLPLGTAGAFSLIDFSGISNAIILYGDIYMNFHLRKFIDFYELNQADAALAVHPNDHPYDSDLVRIDETSKVIAFISKPHDHLSIYPNMVNAGAYIISTSLLSKIPKNIALDFGKDLFPVWVHDHHFVGYSTVEYLKDMGTPKRLDQVSYDVQIKKDIQLHFSTKKPVIFLDRDGVINDHQNTYVTHPDELIIFDDVIDSIKKINQSSYLTMLITNQPIIARNLASFDMLGLIHDKLDTILGNSGVKIDAKYVCPHHPDSGFPEENKDYKIDCDCRKPKPGLLDQAKRDHNVDFERSFFIGDSWRDIHAAQNLGITSIGLKRGEGCKGAPCRPDFLFQSLSEATHWILNHETMVQPFIDEIRLMLEKQLSKPLIIAIAGQSQSGKSTLSKTLSFCLNKKKITTHLIECDQWIIPKNHRKNSDTVRERFQLNNINSELDAFLSGKPLKTLKFDVTRSRVIHESMLMASDADVVIIEGVVALMLPLIRQSAGIRYFIDIDKLTQLKRIQSYYHWKDDLTDDQIKSLYEKRQIDEWDIVQESRKNASKTISFNQFIVG